MTEKTAIFLYFMLVLLAGFCAGYLSASTTKQLGEFQGRPVYAKLDGGNVEISFDDKPMPCQDSNGKPIERCQYIPVVIDLERLK
jgi:hypothetical protein